MQKDLRVSPDELGAAATRWQMIGAGLGAADAPSVNLARTWPSAAATDGIHSQAGAATAGVPAPTMSKHLRVLLAAGIVADERGAQDARVRVFRLRRESVVAVRAWLDQVQAHWDEQLKAFKAHVEREGAR